MSGFDEIVDKALVTQTISDALDIGDFFTQKEETDVASVVEKNILKDQAPPALFMLWTENYSLKRLSSLYSAETPRFNELLKERFRDHPELKGLADGVIFLVLWARSHPTWRLFNSSATQEQLFEFYLGNMVVEPLKIQREYLVSKLTQTGATPASVNEFLDKTQMRFSRFPVLSRLKFNMIIIQNFEFGKIYYVVISDDDALQSIQKSLQKEYKIEGQTIYVSKKNGFLPNTAKEDPNRPRDPELWDPLEGKNIEKELFFIRTKWTAPQIMLFSQHMNNVSVTQADYFKNIRDYIRSTFPK